jgi:hypothetical protein
MGPNEHCLELARLILSRWPDMGTNEIELGYFIQEWAESHPEDDDE